MFKLADTIWIGKNRKTVPFMSESLSVLSCLFHVDAHHLAMFVTIVDIANLVFETTVVILIL